MLTAQCRKKISSTAVSVLHIHPKPVVAPFSSSSFADSTIKGNDLAVEAPLPRDLEEVLEEIRQESSG